VLRPLFPKAKSAPTPFSNNPDSNFNATNPANFGTFAGGQGSFSNVGAHRSHGIMVFRLEF
jgi:hypothetical protein